MKQIPRLFMTALSGLGILVIVSIPEASAHIFPLRSEPRVGSELKAPPSEVRIWFDGNLEPFFSSIEVRDSNGASVGNVEGMVDPQDRTLLKIGLPPLHDGKYRVYWSVVSLDGHRTEGDFSFTVKVSP